MSNRCCIVVVFTFWTELCACALNFITNLSCSRCWSECCVFAHTSSVPRRKFHAFQLGEASENVWLCLKTRELSCIFSLWGRQCLCSEHKGAHLHFYLNGWVAKWNIVQQKVERRRESINQSDDVGCRQEFWVKHVASPWTKGSVRSECDPLF